MIYLYFIYAIAYAMVTIVETLSPKNVGRPEFKLLLAVLNLFLIPLLIWAAAAGHAPSVSLFIAMLLSICSAFAVTAVVDEFTFLNIGHGIFNILINLIYFMVAIVGYVVVDFKYQPISLLMKLDIVALFTAAALYVPVWLGKTDRPWVGDWCAYAAATFLVLSSIESVYQLLEL